jgi:hypothetical protein
MQNACSELAAGHNLWSHRRRLEEGASATKLLFRSFGDRDMERQETSPQEYRNVEIVKCKMSICRNVEMRKRRKTFLVKILAFMTWNVETLHHKKCQNGEMRNAEMAKCKTPKYQGSGLGVSKHFITEVSKCRNAKRRKTFVCSSNGVG